VLGDWALILGGLVLLGGGGEALVRGAVGLARSFRVTPAVIGLTVVAAGTSMPELVVSVMAALRGSPDIAAANVIGSNIFNLGLVLGLTSLILVLPVESTTLKWEWPFLLLVSMVTAVLMRDGHLGRAEGSLFLFALVAFLAVMVRMARGEVRRREASAPTVLPPGADPGEGGWFKHGAILAAGCTLVVFGGKLVVDGATGIALAAGLSERMVGLTIVAMGTSLPELASSLVAAARGRSDVAVGNLVGSSIFNLLGILGVGASLVPIQVDPALVHQDLLWMLALTLFLAPLIYPRRRLGRIEGFLLLGVFTIYMLQLIF